MTPNLTPTQLRDPSTMLETLRAAYQHQLDEVDAAWGAPSEDRRLSEDEQTELGRRLAFYWGETSATCEVGA